METRGLTLCVWILSCWMILPIAGLIQMVSSWYCLLYFHLCFTWTNAGYWLRKYQEEGTRYS